MSYIAKRTDGRANAPLLLTFHGTGGTEEQFHRLGQELMPGAHVVSPRGNVSEMGALRFFHRTGEGVYDMADLEARIETMAAFIAEEKTRTDATRTIGIGYSNGANILAATALKYPELVDDLILMHPLIPWNPAPQTGLGGRRVLITAGQRDPIGPAPMTQDLANYFEAQGATTSLVWHDGGHEIRREELTAVQKFLDPAPAQ